ncbi:Aldo/keto reductase [Xylariomycetidae sp. FL2044]|nr:Aldo/keto reductase [Xylariomycetidae sp. FL2044]
MSSTSASMPRLLYGTAWKKQSTADLVLLALKAGFRAIDTAAQPRHYNEKLAAAGIKTAISSGVVKREDIFIQTKFTPTTGQDLDNLPYDPEAPVAEQVHASVASSLQNFTFGSPEEAYIDSLVLHSPLRDPRDTVNAWKALESYVPHKIRQLGISNTPLGVVEYLCTSDRIGHRPACVQNRFYASTKWDVELRGFCREAGIAFQAFSVLTANPGLVSSSPVLRLASEAGVQPPAALYTLVLGLGGVSVLNGTSSAEHMKQDLEGVGVVQSFAQSQGGQELWEGCLSEFKTLIGEP